MRPRCCALQRFIKHCVSHFKRRCAQLSLRIMGSTSCNRMHLGTMNTARGVESRTWFASST